MANLNPAPSRLATIRTPHTIVGGSNVTRALRMNQRQALRRGSNAAPAFRAETQADFRYTSIQGAVPKW